MTTSIAPRTGFLSANDTLPTVATCLLRLILVLEPCRFLRSMERAASRILCPRILLAKVSRVGAVPVNPDSPSSTVASGNIDIIADSTLSGSSLGFTGQEIEMEVMLPWRDCAYIN